MSFFARSTQPRGRSAAGLAGLRFSERLCSTDTEWIPHRLGPSLWGWPGTVAARCLRDVSEKWATLGGVEGRTNHPTGVMMLNNSSILRDGQEGPYFLGALPFWPWPWPCDEAWLRRCQVPANPCESASESDQARLQCAQCTDASSNEAKDLHGMRCFLGEVPPKNHPAPEAWVVV